MSFTYNGSTLNQPGTIVTSQSQGMSQPSGNARLVVLLGVSGGGGQPKTLQYLNGKQDAVNKLLNGPLQTSALRSFKDGNPSVAYMRVNPALQSTGTLQDVGVNTLANIKSEDYGVYTKRVSYQIQTATTQGLKATVALDGTTYSQDNIYQAALSIAYSGADASALVKVTNVSHQMTGSSGAASAEALKWTADFTVYTTLAQLAAFINSQTGWVCTILSASTKGPSQDALDDTVTAGVQAKTGTATITATLGALITWLNNTPLITATRVSGIGTLPVVNATPVYLTSGTDGTSTNTDWSAALTALQNVPQARVVVVATGDASIHAMVDTHCKYVSDPTVRQNRVQIAGGIAGEAVSATLVRSQGLNSRRTSLVWPGIQDNDDITGLVTTYDPFHLAAQAAGNLASQVVTTALTRKAVTCIGLENNLQSTLQKSDYDQLCTNGVMALKFIQNDSGNAFRWVRSITTWMQDTALDNLELSMVCTEDYVTLAVGSAIDALVGSTGGPIGSGQVSSTVDTALRKLADPSQAVLVGDANMKPYDNVVATLQGQQITVTFTATIPAPMNFFGVTMTFRAYSNVAA